MHMICNNIIDFVLKIIKTDKYLTFNFKQKIIFSGQAENTPRLSYFE